MGIMPLSKPINSKYTQFTFLWWNVHDMGYNRHRIEGKQIGHESVAPGVMSYQ